MTDHSYNVKYVVTQRVTVRTESGDPEAGREELTRRMQETQDQLREVFIQGVGRLQCGQGTVIFEEHKSVRGSGGKI